MSLISRTKRLVGDFFFHCENGLGRYRLKVSDRKPLAVLMYHGLESDPSRLAASSHRVTPEGCLKEIRFFQHQGYRLVTPEEISTLGLRREDKSAGYLLVSFDDGHANIFSHLRKWLEVEKIPVLLGICPGIVEENEIYWWEEVRARFQYMQQASLQIRSSDGAMLSFGKADAQKFEVSGRGVLHQELQLRLEQLRQQTSYIGRQQLIDSIYVHENMGWQQIIELSKLPLCTLASHSMHHEIATQVAPDELRRRTQASLKLLEAKTGCRVQHYIYPNGTFSEETDRVLTGLGILHTYSTECAVNPIPPATRLNRFSGLDYGNLSLRYYGELWRKRHSSAL